MFLSGSALSPRSFLPRLTCFSGGGGSWTLNTTSHFGLAFWTVVLTYSEIHFICLLVLDRQLYCLLQWHTHLCIGVIKEALFLFALLICFSNLLLNIIHIEHPRQILFHFPTVFYLGASGLLHQPLQSQKVTSEDSGTLRSVLAHVNFSSLMESD